MYLTIALVSWVIMIIWITHRGNRKILKIQKSDEHIDTYMRNLDIEEVQMGMAINIIGSIFVAAFLAYVGSEIGAYYG